MLCQGFTVLREPQRDNFQASNLTDFLKNLFLLDNNSFDEVCKQIKTNKFPFTGKKKLIVEKPIVWTGIIVKIAIFSSV